MKRNKDEKYGLSNIEIKIIDFQPILSNNFCTSELELITKNI